MILGEKFRLAVFLKAELKTRIYENKEIIFFFPFAQISNFLKVYRDARQNVAAVAV